MRPEDLRAVSADPRMLDALEAARGEQDHAVQGLLLAAGFLQGQQNFAGAARVLLAAEAAATQDVVVQVKIARITHEVNRAWCEFQGDDSQEPWWKAPTWQRLSAMAGVQFHLANPHASDSASHDEWMRVKLADGWTYGPTKDAEAKTHPCLVPFDQLPREQQFKDRLFRTVVHAAA